MAQLLSHFRMLRRDPAKVAQLLSHIRQPRRHPAAKRGKNPALA
ncbi:hypothetical protein [Cohnella thermotolerans]|nr:hypothetical protein [Cohnella thermotolerans]